MAKVAKIRVDDLVVQRGLCESRSQAKALILTGKVRHGTVVLDKPGKTVPEDIELTVIQPPRYVGRGAEKLAGFIEHFQIPVEGRTVLDVGASTGGFTDYLLQHGAVSSTCVDVGRGQLHDKLRNDPRVTNKEKTNARHLKPGALPLREYDLLVMDLSFISLTLILPAVWPFLKTGGELIALVKPQFEAEKDEVDRGQGVIRDDAVRERVLQKVRDFAAIELIGSHEIGVIECPLSGADGNREYLLGLRKLQLIA